MQIGAVVFDLDGLLVQSEEVWDEVRRGIAAAAGRPWPKQATRAMMGMSAPEWSRYMRDEVGLPGSPEEIDARVVEAVRARYDEGVPWIEGSLEAVRRMGARWPLALASSSNRELIDAVLDAGGIAGCFAVTVSSEEVPRGKPSPDVYLEAARLLGLRADRCAAVEDSSNGLRSAAAAGMRVIAIPNPAHPPDADALALADVVLESLAELSPTVVAGRA